MGRKAKYSQEQKLQACINYFSGKKSVVQISAELQMGKRDVAYKVNYKKSHKKQG